MEIALAVEPKVEITAFGVFLMEVIEAALEESIEIILTSGSYEIGLREEFLAIRHGAVDDGEGIDLAVGFGDDGAIDGTRRIFAAGTMILYGITHSE